MSKNTIFVTGATGFIGSRLVKELVQQGNRVKAIYRSKQKIKEFEGLPIEWFQGDLENCDVMEQAMTGCSQVYHVAAYAAVWEHNPGDFYKYNVQGTLNVLNAAKKAGVKRVVVTSTAGIFGPSLHGTITEESVSPLPHFTGYESSKAESEKIIQQRVAEGEDIVIVNPTRVFGPGQLNESNSVTKMIKAYTEGKWHVIPGNGKSVGNYVFVNDVVTGHMLAMEKGKAGERYILGGAENISYNHFFQVLSDEIKRNYFLLRLPVAIMLFGGNLVMLQYHLFKKIPIVTPAHIRKFTYNWNVSIEKSKSQLGYSPLSFKESISKTVNWLKNERN